VHATVELSVGWVDLAASVGYGHGQGDDDESRQYNMRDTLLEYHSFEESHKDDSKLQSSFWSWCEAIKPSSFEAYHQKPRQSDQPSTGLRSFLALTQDAESRYHFEAMANFWRKRLICNTHSTAIGLLPDKAEAGNVIALISGLHMPVILRPTAQG
jgi:hypothetical protein